MPNLIEKFKKGDISMEDKKIEKRKITDLKPHPLNEEIYNDTYDEQLLYSIYIRGILTPLVITKDNVIISGHRRYEAAKKLLDKFGKNSGKKPDEKTDEKPNPKRNFNELPVTVSDLTDNIAIREAIIEFNENRTKTKEQILREYKELKEIEKIGAKQRQGTRKDFQEKFPGSNQGQARDLAAVKFGMSGKTADIGVKVVDAIDDCKEIVEENLAATNEEEKKLAKLVKELTTILNKRGPHAAYKKAIEEDLIPEDPSLDAETGENPIFNRTVRPIDWAIWSWNPITGCLQGCEYCYAKDMVMRFSDNKEFKPRFYEKRLDAPTNTTFRDEYNANIRFRSVLVCSMADLFGPGVKEEWIDKVMNAIKKAKKWNFLFLTKSPQKMAQYMSRKGVPSNSWVGATVDIKNRIEPTIEAFSKIEAKVKFLYCEPLLEDLESDNSMSTLLEMVDWVVIGAQRRNIKNKVPEFQPKWDWVERLVKQARAAECSVYFKSNLTVRPQEYPEYDSSLQARLSNLEKKLPKEVFDSIKEEWEQIESTHNGGSEYIKNFRLSQFLEDKEKKLDEEGNGDKTGTAKENNTASEEKKFEGEGNGSESDAGEALKHEDNGSGTGEEDKIDSTEEPAQSPVTVN